MIRRFSSHSLCRLCPTIGRVSSPGRNKSNRIVNSESSIICVVFIDQTSCSRIFPSPRPPNSVRRFRGFARRTHHADRTLWRRVNVLWHVDHHAGSWTDSGCRFTDSGHRGGGGVRRRWSFESPQTSAKVSH